MRKHLFAFLIKYVVFSLFNLKFLHWLWFLPLEKVTFYSAAKECTNYHTLVLISKATKFSSVTQSHPNLRDTMNRSTPGLPVHHQLPESTQTHVHWVGDAIQPSHPLLSPSPPALNLSQHQSLFKWVSSCGQSIGVSV